jgi:hypothetical protein
MSFENINPLKQKIKKPVGIAEAILPTKESFTISQETKGQTKGFALEGAFKEALEGLPGVEYVRLSSAYEDVSEGIDLVMKLKGDSELFNIQVTCDPEKIVKEVKPGVIFIELTPEEANEMIKKKLSKRITAKIKQGIGNFLARQRPKTMEALMNVRGID